MANEYGDWESNKVLLYWGLILLAVFLGLGGLVLWAGNEVLAQTSL